MPRIPRPGPGDHAAYYGQYMARFLDHDVLVDLTAQSDELAARLRPLDDDAARFRYAAGKWSVKEVLGHLVDTERMFTYRAMSIARGDPAALPGMDENAWVAGATFDAQPLGDLVDEFVAVRAVTLLFFAGLSPEAYNRRGMANDSPIVVRALPFIICGHAAHHLEILQERYRV